jgi:hypothetical protein
MTNSNGGKANSSDSTKDKIPQPAEPVNAEHASASNVKSGPNGDTPKAEQFKRDRRTQMTNSNGGKANSSDSTKDKIPQPAEPVNGEHASASNVKSGPNGDTPKAEQSVPDSGGPQFVDPFDPKNYRKPQGQRLNFGSDQPNLQLPNTIEVRKPKKTWFIRIHPDPNYRAVLPVFTDDDTKRRENNSYLFAPGLEIPADLESLVRDTLVAAAITNSGIPFLYPLSVTDSSWYESGVEVFRRAREEWIRVTPREGCYEISLPVSKLEEPCFPDVPFREYLERAFSKRLIKSLDDPLVRKLRGIR